MKNKKTEMKRLSRILAQVANGKYERKVRRMEDTVRKS